MTVEGYYVTCDDALCLDCFADAGGEAGWRDRGGFESWPDPLVIDDDEARDTPTHCDECGRLISHPLTEDGARYVAERLVSCFRDGHTTPILREWACEWTHELGSLGTMRLPSGVEVDALAVLELLDELPLIDNAALARVWGSLLAAVRPADPGASR